MSSKAQKRRRELGYSAVTVEVPEKFAQVIKFVAWLLRSGNCKAVSRLMLRLDIIQSEILDRDLEQLDEGRTRMTAAPRFDSKEMLGIKRQGMDNIVEAYEQALDDAERLKKKVGRK